MEPVLRAAAVYLFLFVLFRSLGKRALAEITTFDFVLLLIISEATQPALTGNSMSITNTALAVLTLILLDVAISLIAHWFPRTAKWFTDVPLLIVEHGRIIEKHANQARVDEADILAAARESQGLERIEQIKFAVLERNGAITIIPEENEGG